MRVEITRAAERDLRKFGASDQAVIAAAIDAYGTGVPGDIKKLKDTKPPQWRMRVGRFRVLFPIDRDRMLILRIADRKDAYR